MTEMLCFHLLKAIHLLSVRSAVCQCFHILDWSWIVNNAGAEKYLLSSLIQNALTRFFLIRSSQFPVAFMASLY